jgi:hypothetical protein
VIAKPHRDNNMSRVNRQRLVLTSRDQSTLCHPFYTARNQREGRRFDAAISGMTSALPVV